MNRLRVDVFPAITHPSPAAARHFDGRFETIVQLTGATPLDDKPVVAESGLDVGALDRAAIPV